MKRNEIGSQGLFALAAVLILYGTAVAQNQVLVAASISPLADFARQVGGERVRVITLVPPGASPHIYELKPSQVEQVARARVLILNGAGLEYWAGKLVESTGNRNLRVVDTSDGITLIDDDEHHDHGGNPHIWLDANQAMIQVGHIRDALSEADPDGAPLYRENAGRYLGKLEELDREIAEEVKTWARREFIAFHPAWVYFSRRYGLRQAASIEESPGREPSPAEMVELIKNAKRIGARAIFAEPQFSSKAAEAVASELSIKILMLDPLGSSLKDSSYIGLMRYNTAQMALALK